AARRHPQGHPADPAAEGDPRVGLAQRRPEAGRREADGGVRRLHRPDRPRGRPNHPGDRGHGQLDNTLIFWEIGDNGAAMEGTTHGVFTEMSSLNGVPEDTAYAIKHIDEIGGPNAYNHYPVGWAWAMNTPFQWGKQVASHLGGVRNPLVVSWPKRIKDV